MEEGGGGWCRSPRGVSTCYDALTFNVPLISPSYLHEINNARQNELLYMLCVCVCVCKESTTYTRVIYIYIYIQLYIQLYIDIYEL